MIKEPSQKLKGKSLDFSKVWDEGFVLGKVFFYELGLKGRDIIGMVGGRPGKGI